jgi:four helix bundle protein
MDAEDFKTRTKQFALRIIRLAESLPKSASARVLSGQLLRAGTSVGSNYRSACRARSRADFVAKMGIVEEECDESLYWMELLIEAKLVKPESLANLRKEGTEILSIVVSSIKTARTPKQPATRTTIQ